MNEFDPVLHAIDEIASVINDEEQFHTATFSWLVDGMFQMAFTGSYLVASGDMNAKPIIDKVMQIKTKLSGEIDRRVARWEEK